MNILWFAPRYLPAFAGGETYVLGVAKELVAMGHSVGVVCGKCGVEENRFFVYDDGIKVYRVDALDDIGQFFSDVNPDFVFTQFEWSARVIRFCNEHKTPVAVVIHGDWPSVPALEPELINKVDFYIFNSRDTLRRALKMGARPNHVILTPPVDVCRIAINSTCVRDKIALINCIEFKGVRVLESLAAKLPRKHFVGILGGYGKQIKDGMSSIEYRANGSFAENMRDVRVLLMPSKYESWGMAGLDAQFNGIPVVANDISSLHDSLGDGAYFCHNEEIAAWVAAITKLDNPGEYKRMSVKAMANARMVMANHDMQIHRLIDAIGAVFYEREKS